ncbi:hypothetical protein Purlil1_1393 [Purpureocillium lilacinum]|uniref:Uncharacterized protein n=1 Tax=Purpureocillium lilacinum TaxID=33203 RepID=A0ABR0CCC1_PURLI|nr:hypothetical protein Purlil1_1393 [Purpureocillium lilacinum]
MPRRRQNDGVSEDDGGPTNKAEQARAEAAATKAARQQMGMARDHFKDRKPPNPDDADDLAEVLGVAAPEYDGLWSEADEHALRDDYEGSGMDRAVQSIDASNRVLLKLWKTACWEMRCSSLAIVGPRYGMVFESSARNTTQSTQASELVWSKGFAEALNNLISHPVFDGDVAMLATAIQAAVIFRTDERRRWHIRCAPVCEAMETLIDTATTPFDRPVADTMRAAEAHCAQNGRKASPFFLLLRHIGLCVGSQTAARDTANARARASRSGRDSPVEYRVRVGDLNAVVEAVNTLKGQSSVPVFLSVETVAAISFASRQRQSMSHGLEELQRAYRRAWFHEMREARKRDRRDASGGTAELPIRPAARRDTRVAAATDRRTGQRPDSFDSFATSERVDAPVRARLTRRVALNPETNRPAFSDWGGEDSNFGPDDSLRSNPDIANSNESEGGDEDEDMDSLLSSGCKSQARAVEPQAGTALPQDGREINPMVRAERRGLKLLRSTWRDAPQSASRPGSLPPWQEPRDEPREAQWCRRRAP